MKLHVVVSAAVLMVLSASSQSTSAAPGGGGGGVSIECPPTVKVTCGGSTDPDVTGRPTVTSTCPGKIDVTFEDFDVPNTGCAADRFDHVTQRVWTATDACGNTASCKQDLNVVRQRWSLDIKPTSCPNPINTTGSGNATVSIAVLGTTTQDVALIDTSTIEIWREGCTAGPVTPRSASEQDVAAPFPGETTCECWTAGPDGIMDLRLAFNRGELVNGLDLTNVPYGSQVRLVLSGRTVDGCSFIATDCVRVQ